MILALMLASAVPIIPDGQAFNFTPTHVWDGDGQIWCEEGPRIRLAGIAAREMDGSCRPGHPCPDADPVAARDALANLVGKQVGRSSYGHVLVVGPTMLCRSTGGAGGDRIGAWCMSPRGGDLSWAMVRDHWAAVWQRYWGTHRCAIINS
ncbi:thermonuclease family protein [Novosphingopyxis sp.]|uniref:thermonuclease family protein n=1 Tax=Novosphingopyxis sp. TaxID=2709690 RepID=UPI003B58F41C